jgi:predicted PurR-regulated permease PerM
MVNFVIKKVSTSIEFFLKFTISIYLYIYFFCYNERKEEYIYSINKKRENYQKRKVSKNEKCQSVKY